jgi:uncharacterized protein YegL
MATQNQTKVKQEIVVILDKSGSMGGSRDDVVGGFNTYIEDLRKEEDIEANLTIYMFDDNTHKICTGESLKNVNLLTSKTYCPGGSTALNDCFMEAINDVETRLKKSKAKNKPQVLFIVFTDGEENASRTHVDKSKIKQRKDDKESEGWAFIFMGADMDAWAAGSSYGMSLGNTMTINKQSIGSSASYLRNRTVKAASNYRGLVGGTMNEVAYAQSMNNLMTLDADDLANDAEAVALRAEIDSAAQNISQASQSGVTPPPIHVSSIWSNVLGRMKNVSNDTKNSQTP